MGQEEQHFSRRPPARPDHCREAPADPRHDPQSTISVQIACDPASIEALEQEWDALEQDTPEATGFQSFKWCHAWVAANARQRASALCPYVIVVRQNARVVWLLPLQVETRFGVRWARGLGQPVTPYADALAIASPRRAVWSAAAEAALRRRDVVDVISMIQVRADSVLAKLPGSGFVRRTCRSAPFLDLTDAAALAHGLASGRSLRRRNRALKHAHPISMETARSAAEAATAVHHALDLKLKWLETRRLHRSSLLEPAARPFLETLASSGGFEVHHLRVGANTAAVDVGFVRNGTYRSLLSTYDTQYAFGSPSHMLTRLLIEDCRKRGIREFDLLAPNEPYKATISSGAIDIVCVHKALTMRGRLGMVASLKLRRPFYAATSWRDRFIAGARASLSRVSAGLALRNAAARHLDQSWH